MRAKCPHLTYPYFRHPPERPRSPAPALVHGHVHVVLDHGLAVVIQVEQRLRLQLGGHAAGPGHGRRLDGADQRLEHRVVGRVHVVGQRKRALTVTVVRIVAGRRLDPVAELDVGEVHVQRVSLADLFLRPGPVVSAGLIVGRRPFAAQMPFHHRRRRPFAVLV